MSFPVRLRIFGFRGVGILRRGCGTCILHVLMGKNPSLDVGRAANALIGAYRLNDPYLKGVDTSGVPIECNYSDLCSDADSLDLAQRLKKDRNDSRSLSRVMRGYYAALSTVQRYSAYQHDLGRDFRPPRLATVVQEKMAKTLLDELFELGLAKFYQDATDKEREACCRAFAHYLSVKIRR